MSENFLALDGVSGGDGPRNPQRLLAKIEARYPPVALADRGQADRLGAGPGAGGRKLR